MSNMKWLTSIKSSSAPLNKNISGLGGTQPESIVSLAISNIDATREEKSWERYLRLIYIRK